MTSTEMQSKSALPEPPGAGLPNLVIVSPVALSDSLVRCARSQELSNTGSQNGLLPHRAHRSASGCTLWRAPAHTSRHSVAVAA